MPRTPSAIKRTQVERSAATVTRLLESARQHSRRYGPRRCAGADASRPRRHPDASLHGLSQVLLAGRTEPDLLAALLPLIVRQNEDLCAAARKNPVFARLSDESQQVIKDIAQHTLALETLWRPTLPEPDLDEFKLEALIDLLFLVDAAESRDRQAN